jgi:hypothetical protein
MPNTRELAPRPDTPPPRTGREVPWLPRGLFAASAAVLLSLAACATQTGAPSLQGKPLSGYVQMRHVHAAYIGSGSAGDGTLSYMGHTYPFRVGGLGIGGIGVSTVQATGEVYGLRRLSDFPGAYGQIRYGFALGSKSAGNLWLQKGNGVILHLVAKRQGLMLSLGGDADVISL